MADTVELKVLAAQGHKARQKKLNFAVPEVTFQGQAYSCSFVPNYSALEKPLRTMTAAF